MVSSNEELSWAAAFIEGEGSICCFKSSGRKVLRVTLSASNTQREYIDRLQGVLGGGIHVRQPRKDKRIVRSKISYAWRLYTKVDVLNAIESLLPFMTPGTTKYEKALAARRELNRQLKGTS